MPRSIHRSIGGEEKIGADGRTDHRKERTALSGTFDKEHYKRKGCEANPTSTTAALELPTHINMLSLGKDILFETARRMLAIASSEVCPLSSKPPSERESAAVRPSVRVRPRVCHTRLRQFRTLWAFAFRRASGREGREGGLCSRPVADAEGSQQPKRGRGGRGNGELQRFRL